ncbi:MarR family winged helix-turn-helix transcriptional regulator [Streptomyces sp. B1I3]|uniref:MarR family winged helix-turn-helix transcriptional regulator n=1 Tax=Streptomyces sp. B1I3 TaxID=3042264 RepID=UPI00277DB53D|nr:MarR family transcriptional regulator [Streptomyces sp. B1I3]MDQ0794874.1 DNA-binding MarR family transcriptional regulator [Streptomyces sp. B1I3]
MSDHVDRVLTQWAEQFPELDASSMGVIGRVKRLARILEAELRTTFGAHDLDPAAFDVLATLRRSPAPHRLTPADLMRSAMVTSGAITQRLDRLEARGLVTRVPRQEDGRSVHVALTGEGEELIDRALVDHVDTQNRLLSGISGEQRERIADDLRSLLESLGDTDRHQRRI